MPPSPPPLTTAETVDLSNCDREPIHIPGAVQNHGLLLVLNPSDMTIVQIGGDGQRWLGPDCGAEQLLGQTIERLLKTDQYRQLQHGLSQGNLDLNPLYLFTLTPGSNATAVALDVTAHVHDGLLLLDLELSPAAGFQSVPDYYRLVKQSVAKLQAVAGLRPFCQRLAEDVRELTGMDRVMIYRFLPDGSGWVFAESRRDDLDAYLDLHYPASDIPQQARALYLRSWLRLIADVDAPPRPLQPALNPLTGRPLDLSHSALRSVSPVHIEYLKNMGVRASMSISLINNDRLWGLIACHHCTPRQVGYGVRAACEFLGQMVSLQLAAKEDAEHYDYRLALNAVRERLTERLNEPLNDDDSIDTVLAARLLNGSPTLLDAIDATGVAIVINDAVSTLGRTPDEAALRALLVWLVEQRAESVFATEALALLYPPAEAFADTASGLLAVQISRQRRDFLLWFRPETPHTVTWAGNPNKPVRVGPLGERLMPRQSFAAWREAVRLHAVAWQAVEIEAVTKLRLAIMDVVIERVEALGRLNTELSHRNEELDAFAYIASHDLKEPLRGIYGYAQFLIDELGEQVDEKSQQRMQALLRLTRRMENLIDSLLHYAQAGRQAMVREPADFNTLLDEALELLERRRGDSGAAIRVPRPLPTLSCDPVQAREVLTNLIDNALKYNDKPDAWIEVGYLTPSEAKTGLNRGQDSPPVNNTVIYVRDNGIGIRERHLRRIFTLFKRLHARDEYGGGTGIGLTIAKKIIDRHGGALWADSSVGEGTTFYFTLAPEPAAD